MNKKIKFSITLDYELMGNGEGHVYDLMINPTNKFLAVCDKYNVKSTIFFEVIEYWKIKEAFQNGLLLDEYKTDPTLDIEKQLKNAVKNGHDVQLHMHPQWLDAKFINGKWVVNDKLHRLPDLAEYSKTTGYSISSLIEAGKKTLEDLFKPVNKNYSCHVFRAGGLNIYPSERILEALRENDFDTDSSVFPYAYSNTLFTKYDFRKISNNIFYWITKSNTLTDPQNIVGKNKPVLELPLYSLLIRRYKKYDLFRLYNKFINKHTAIRTFEQAVDRLSKKKIIEQIKFFFEKESVIWDFCLFNKTKHKKYLKSVIKNSSINSQITFYPIVLIGHSKEINSYNLKILDWFFRTLSEKNIEIQLLSSIAKDLLKDTRASF